MRNKFTKIPFKDISTIQEKIYIEDLYRQCIVDGKTRFYFGGNDPISRAELLTIVIKAFQPGTVSYESIFTDIYKGDWFAPYIIKAVKLGIIYANAKNDIKPSLNPQGYFTREQALYLIMKAK